MKKKKTIKAWAIVSWETGELMWTDVHALNSDYGAGTSEPAIYSTKVHALANAGCDFVVPCTITY